MTIASPWPAPPPSVALDADEVHVWRVRLDVSPARLAELSTVLEPEERERAARFRFPRHRDRALAARAIVRMILAGYLRRDPACLRLAAGPHGKPRLAVAAGAAPLRFNLAHADDLALVAVAWRREVGVDVERQQPDRVDLDVARRMFAPEDADGLAALPPPLRLQPFFALWTRREAYAKGTGLGLAAERSAVPDADWTQQSLPIDPGYAAALAVEGGAARVRCWQWASAAVRSGAAARA